MDLPKRSQCKLIERVHDTGSKTGCPSFKFDLNSKLSYQVFRHIK